MAIMLIVEFGKCCPISIMEQQLISTIIHKTLDNNKMSLSMIAIVVQAEVNNVLMYKWKLKLFQFITLAPPTSFLLLPHYNNTSVHPPWIKQCKHIKSIDTLPASCLAQVISFIGRISGVGDSHEVSPVVAL